MVIVIPNLRVNQQIRLSPVRLIDGEGGLRGIVPTEEALQLARDSGMDLVEVSPNERPPVCKIMDYGKYKYLQSKKLKQKHHEQKLKELRLRPKTDPHDKDIKVKRAREFLGHGDRVQFTMMFRGRERFHKDMGIEIFDEILADLGDQVKVEQPAKLIGRKMIMVVVPGKPVAPAKKPKPASEADGKKPRKPAAEDGSPVADGDRLIPREVEERLASGAVPTSPGSTGGS